MIEIAVKNIIEDDDKAVIKALGQQKRMLATENTSDLDDVLLSDEAQDAIDAADQKEGESHSTYIAESKTDMEVLEKAASDKIQQLREKLKKKGKKRKPAQKIPKDESLYTQANVQALLPSGARCLKDYFNGRWRFWYKSEYGMVWQSRSRSWGKISHQQCVTELLKWVWGLAEVDGEICFVSGL